MSNTFSKEEAVSKSTEYFEGDILAAEVFVSKYALRNEKLELVENSPEQMHRRLAKEFSRIEKKYPDPMSEDDIFGLFDRFKYIAPQGSPMFGIGNQYQKVSISNCFVIDLADSYGGICRADERIAQISKRRGGVGMDISPLRPKGTPTHNSALTTDGVVGFMERFSNTSREVAQSGRRGALLMSISVHHPEILNFIRAKSDKKRITGANISVRITDEFMDAVKKDKLYELRWPVDSEKPTITEKIKARIVWEEIIKRAHANGEPGVLFWDTIIRNSPADCYTSDSFATTSTNPCGELPLGIAGSCILLLINLSSYVENPFTKDSAFNKELFASHVIKAQRLLDDMVDLEVEAVEKIIKKIQSDPEPDDVKANELSLWKLVKDRCVKSRRTGLGITGLADCIAMLGEKYGSPESIKIVNKIYQALRDGAYRSSIEMAKSRGPFPIWDNAKEKSNEFLNRLPEDILKDMSKHGRRNIACLTTSPAGSVSTLTQTSSGFEPVFKTMYFRKKKIMDGEKIEPDFIDETGDKWKEYKIVHNKLKLFTQITGKEFKDSPYFGSEAEEIDYMAKIKMQSLATKCVDHAISNTVNLPNNVTVDTVEKLYMTAYDQGCKGLTVYRSGSRDGVLTGESTKNCIDCDDASKTFTEMMRMATNLVVNGHRPEHIIPAAAPKRPEVVQCEIHRSKVAGEEWLFLIGTFEGQIYEVFGGSGEEFTIPLKYKNGWIVKNGKVDGVTQYNLVLGSLTDKEERLEFKGIAKHFNNGDYGAFTRLTSLVLRHGVPIKYVCEQITKKGVEGDLFSFQRALARVLKKYIADGEKSGLTCPVCQGSEMVYKGECPTCVLCGHSQCS